MIAYEIMNTQQLEEYADALMDWFAEKKSVVCFTKEDTLKTLCVNKATEFFKISFYGMAENFDKEMRHLSCLPQNTNLIVVIQSSESMYLIQATDIVSKITDIFGDDSNVILGITQSIEQEKIRIEIVASVIPPKPHFRSVKDMGIFDGLFNI